jgi:hypothetical protein
MSLISEALSRFLLGASDSRSASRPEAPLSAPSGRLREAESLSAIKTPALGGRLPAGESPSANKEEKGSSTGPLVAYQNLGEPVWAPRDYPFVTALIALAADVKSVLGSDTKVLYAADWSEYFGHQPADGSGDVYFHLDPLWSSANIDAIGLDVYWPLADWRDGRDHLDAIAGAASIYDAAYLRSNVQGGEGFDWYYASAADRTRNSARRSPTAAASRGSFATRIFFRGGATRITIVQAARKARTRPRGCRSRSRSGSWNSAARPSTKAPISRTSSSIRKARNRCCHIIRAAFAMT